MFRNERKMKRHAAKWMSAATIMSLIFGSTLAQEVSPLAYQMSVIKDEAYGRLLMSGDYDKGIARIGSYSNKRGKTFSAKNNLCVAYTLTRKFDDAAAACETALSISERFVKHSGSPFSSFTSRGLASRDLALAYSNRGVLRAVTGDADGARQDFEFAARANTDMQAANENLARLESSQATAVSSL